MSNYPPGAANDPRAPYNQPDISHEHEFETVEFVPLFEDGAAILRQECRYEHPMNYEPGYEGPVITESISCKEYRNLRFEPVRITELDDKKSWKRDEFEGEEGALNIHVEQALHDIEGRDANDDEVEVVEVYPDEQTGHIIAKCLGWRIRYAITAQTNREAD